MTGASKKTYKHKNGKQVSYYTATYRDMYGKQHTVGRFKTKSEALKHGLKLEESSPDITDISSMDLQKFIDEIEHTHTPYELLFLSLRRSRE